LLKIHHVLLHWSNGQFSQGIMTSKAWLFSNYD